MAIAVTRLPFHLTPDPSRVITRLFSSGRYQSDPGNHHADPGVSRDRVVDTAG